MIEVSRETSDRLIVLTELIRKWSPAINLVAPEDLDQLAERHIKDSLQLASMIAPGHLVDLGSGGGFPGLVIAATLPSMQATLVEADGRKAAFLRTAARAMKLTRVSVVNGRIEDASPQNGDTVTARALAPLPKLLGYVHRHLRPGGTALLMKGARWATEVDEALQMWDFTFDAIPSLTDPNAAVLNVTNLRLR